MTVNELLDEISDPTGLELWITKYEFKKGLSNYLYRHLPPTPIMVHSFTNGERYQSIRFNYISEKTGLVLDKWDYLTDDDEVFTTKDECVGQYKKLVQDHIQDKKDTIKKLEKSIEKLEKKVESFN